jgi:hypothetical protein
MQALTPTEFTARVVWLGRVTDRAARLEAEALAEAELTFAGIAGEAHGGVTRPSCSRVREQHKIGTEIANVRRFFRPRNLR